jgi:hypothetical protein
MSTHADKNPTVAPILWLGGSPCSGKSSIAQALAQRYGLTAYHCDDHWDAHVAQADPEQEPHMARIGQMSWDEIWMRPVAAQVSYELGVYREEFPMILRDLAERRHQTAGLLAEGAALLPEGVAPLITDARQALWVVPTAAFQRRVYPNRGAWVQQILAQCSDPEQALANWMNRDIAFARHVAAQAEELGLRVLWVDGETTLAENTRIVEAWFAPCLAPS